MRPFLPLLLLVACKKTPDVGEGLLGNGWADPFPNAALVADGKLALDDLLPVPDGGTPLPVERIAWRTGFSPGQPSVVRLPGVDPAALPGWSTPTPGEGGVRVADLTAGEWLPCMAELDAHPDATEPVLLVRPLQAAPVGHRIAVVVTTEATARPERFDALVTGRPPASLAEHEAHYVDLLADLEALGIPPEEIALAWDYPVGDGTIPLASALGQVEPPSAWTLDRVRELEQGDRVAPHTWRAAEGTFTVQDFLVDDLWLNLSADGSVLPTGSAEAELYVHVPTSVKDAPAGSVPVLVFGHGIFGEPDDYLDDSEDGDGLLAIAEEGGFLVVATTWRGLTADDRLEALQSSNDFGLFPLVPDRVVQGQVAVRSLIALVAEGGLLDDAALAGADGQALGDPDRIFYYGISLGGIEGAVMMAQDPPVEAAVLHVGGAMWSTMLERSTQWPVFEIGLVDTVPDPADRQVLYAATQLWWDAVDPIAYTEALGGRPLLWQEALGDEQVANLTTRALARSVGVPVLEPAADAPWGLEAAEGPLGPGAAALAQFDPELGEPEDTNRPPVASGAHSTPRTWPGARDQVLRFLDPDDPGTVEHFCGDAPCSASNPGD